jgi:hypothetical protein
MYLQKKTYVQNGDWMEENERHQVTVLKGGKATLVQPERISEIVEEVACWRKANAIHRWFVENVQQGEDNCGEYRVSEDDLRELLSLCTQVLEASELVDGEITTGYTFENGERVPIVEKGRVIKDQSKARELLPTQNGFFFGNTDYDQYYRDDIKYTKEALEHLLAEERSGDYYYSSSW